MWSVAANGAFGVLWDKPVVPMPQVERRFCRETDVEHLSVRRGVTTEA